MPYAQFEEKEYEGPLNNELLEGSPHLWTPGQVFEFYFGIDAAIRVQNRQFWRTMGSRSDPVGVSLPNFKWSYLWKQLGYVRRLPAFDLNLFLQTKRPFVVERPRGVFSNLGYTTPFWRFKITGHQQRALQRLAQKVGSAGLVSYGCAAFDTLDELYRFIPNRQIVSNSTFVKASYLRGHKHWAYESPGAVGSACSEPEQFKDKQIFDQIEAVGNSNDEQLTDYKTATSNILRLANQMHETCVEELREFDEKEVQDADDSGNARASFFVENAISMREMPKIEGAKAMAAFHDVSVFCHLYDLSWHVIG